MDKDWERLRRVISKLSFERRKVILRSGRTSDFYIDGKQTSLNPEGAYLIGKLFFRRLVEGGPPVEAIGGMTLGADPLVTAVTVVSFMEGNPLPAFIVRKERKGHGTGSWIEGMKNIPRGARVAILEDVVTTGGTILMAIKRAQEEGLTVVRVLALVDREEGASEQLVRAGFRLEAIYRKSDLIG